MSLRRASVFGLVLAFSSSAVFAQSLAEIAAKEKERRKDAKPTKVYTEEDLSKGRERSGGDAAETTETSPADSGGASSSGTAPDGDRATPGREEEQKAWRDRIRTAREEQAQLETAFQDLQTRVNNQRQFGTVDERLDKEFAEVSSKRDAGRQAIESLESEGRYRGYRE